MFSEAISSISCLCRPSSPWIAAAISGSACGRLAVKNESGADAVLALLEGGVISEISPLPQALRGGGRLSTKSGNCARRIAYRAAPAKDLRCAPHSYARYGGDRGLETPPLGSLPRCGKTTPRGGLLRSDLQGCGRPRADQIEAATFFG